MRSADWSASSVGAPETWPQSLRSTISMLLPSKAQIILFWGPDFIVFYNDAYRPVFGAKHPQALGRPGREAWSELWDGRLHQLLAGVVRTGEAFWGKDLLFFLERHGFVEETYFDVSYDPVRGESGSVSGVFCIVTETTERVVGARRMALLRDLAAHNATARTQLDACVLAMETLAASPHDATFALAYIDGELQASTPGADQMLAAALPGQVRVLDVPSGASGSPGRLVVGLNPKRPFDNQYRAFLELVADQLSTALGNARAYESERRRAESLAELDRTKTAFFSNVSHEFRTPLTLLLGPVQDALSGPDRALTGDALVTVNRNALRLLKLVNTLLDFARIEAGRAQATYEATDLAAFTTDLAGAFRSAIESAGLRFDVDCAPIDQLVYIDRPMWEKVVFNLLSNALKFTFDGRIRLRVEGAGENARLTVSDTGIGIPEHELPYVFDRFHRVRASRARTHEGTGIGLALAQELVRLHGGSITVASTVGEGTTFTATIPFGSTHLGAESMAKPRSHSPATVGADAYVTEAWGWLGRTEMPQPVPHAADRPARILLADDNADMRDYVGRLLGERWLVDSASDGVAALAAARQHVPDVVVTDVMMPELDGFELLAALRADPATQHVPVILLSARAGEEATLKGIEAGADDYLVKPFTARDLLTRVDAQVTRARARESVRERTRLIENLLNNVPLGVFLVDPDLRLAYVNPAAAPVLGGTHDLVGRSLGDVIHRLWAKQDAAETVRIIRHTLDTGESYVTSDGAPFRDDHGGLAYYEWGADRVVGPDGRFGVMCSFRDVTARKHDEEMLRRSEQQLAEANRLKDEFLATLSHELRTPLNAILGWAHMLRTGTLRADARERALESLVRNAKLQAQLVDDLLDVSRIMSSKLEIRREALDLTVVIAAAVDTIRPTAAAGDVQLRVGFDAGNEALVEGDAGRLQQVVSNLLSNAVKFTPPGGTVDVDVRNAGARIEVIVHDSGEGIDPAFLPHVFDRFRQGNSTASRRHGGLGLGLAIVRHLTESHGGTVSAHSDGPGTGTTFVVSLPRVEQHRAAHVLVPAAQPQNDGLATIRVLVVDDEPDSRELVAFVLENIGGRVTAVDSAREALQVLGQQRFDVLVADVGMPEQDGYSLIRAIRRDVPGGEGIRAIAVSAYASLRDREEALAAGFDDHLGKPADPDKLLAAVAALARR